MKRFLQIIKNPFVIIAVITAFFFWQVFVKGWVPYPADMLLAEYNPWRHTSYFGYVAGSIPNKAQYFDVIRELYPWKTLVIEQMKHGLAPLWNPYNFSGAPLMANYQSQAWYPLSILYYFLPQPTAWTVMAISQLLLGSIFTYLFATSIGLTSSAGVLVAVLFNFSSFSTVWMEFNTVWHTILWVPFILYLIEKRFAAPFKKRDIILFVFAIFSSMTAGHPQDFINCMILVVIYSAARIYTNKTINGNTKKTISLQLIGLGVLTFLIGSVQLLPTIQLFINSARVAHDVNFIVHSMLIQLWQLPIAIISDFFGNPATRTYVLNDTYINKSLSVGVIGFTLFVISFWSKRNFQIKFFQFTAAILLILSTNNPISRLFYLFPIPLLSTGTPTRNLFIYVFSISILAGFGYDHLKSMRSIRKPLIYISLLFLAIFICYIARPTLMFPFVPITLAAIKRSFVISLIILATGGICIILSRKISILRIGLIFLACIELYIGFNKFNAFVPPAYIFPDNEILTYLQSNAGISRFWGYGTAQIEANFATQYHIYSPDGTDPLNLKWYNAFLQSSADGDISKPFTKVTRSDASIKGGYGETDLPENPFRLRVMDALGVRYILDRTENPKNSNTFNPERFTPVWHKEDWTIYENLYAAKRFFLTGDVQTYTTDKEFEQYFFDPAFNPKSTILIPKESLAHLVDETEIEGQLDLLTYKPNEIHFQTKTRKPQYLFLSDTYDKGWKTYIDGKRVPTIKADYAFRAVYIPTGAHDIQMSYMPDEYILGVLLSVVGLCIFGWYIRKASA